jgi:hypothetical protein
LSRVTAPREPRTRWRSASASMPICAGIYAAVLYSGLPADGGARPDDAADSPEFDQP